jgi:outer membrane receptor protein involved in Fe transport
VFHSGYLTLGSTFGRLSVQAGARAEAARTTFDVRSTGQRFEHDYRSLFPSGNAAWDFGKGRSVRATYSKRIERPSAWYLNPDVPANDSLNVTVGNPYLGPKYTHSYSLDASWNGSRGSLRLSPYLRHTIGNWDMIATVDPNGVATGTWRNASSVRVFGASVTGSLRQTGRLGGTLNVGVSREHHDAGNLSEQFRRDVTGWSASGNLTFKATGTLDVQGYLRYSPPRVLAQGRSSAYKFLQLSAPEAGRTGVAEPDGQRPLPVGRYWSNTGDSSYSQTSTSRNRMRSVSGSLTWTWGKAPEQKQRRQTAEQPQGDSPAPGR